MTKQCDYNIFLDYVNKILVIDFHNFVVFKKKEIYFLKNCRIIHLRL